MAAKTFSPKVKQEVEAAVAEYNGNALKDLKDFYQFAVEFKGKFIYVKLQEGHRLLPAGRLEYDDTDGSYHFAIFKWSRENYDPNEFDFPGSEHLDGSVNGALKAIHVAYPPR